MGIFLVARGCRHPIVACTLAGRGPVHATVHEPLSTPTKPTLSVSMKDDTTTDAPVCSLLAVIQSGQVLLQSFSSITLQLPLASIQPTKPIPSSNESFKLFQQQALEKQKKVSYCKIYRTSCSSLACLLVAFSVEYPLLCFPVSPSSLASLLPSSSLHPAPHILLHPIPPLLSYPAHLQEQALKRQEEQRREEQRRRAAEVQQQQRKLMEEKR